METPKNLNDINMEYIISYVKSKGEKDIKWLKELNAKKVDNDKNGKARKISFIEIRNEFARKYFPDLVPKAKEKKKTMNQMIDDL